MRATGLSSPSVMIRNCVWISCVIPLVEPGFYVYIPHGWLIMLSTLLPVDGETVCCPTIHLITVVDHGAVNQCQSPGSILLLDRRTSAETTADSVV